ncbi:conserved hypothetical protein [Xanthomonas oryzae pv. oryzae KACC 10331]|uniref:Uncharacterized protein n=1 Tax=Xanthomonas oryzae pv. oryzae (strain KACC10331 / KXO85) TaxID=291331 RepID=Q5GUI8_XANOR|nr:conserved hypothetical protein [Xanthomonas oryzae pv. oryzae KACC 10331]BAE70880.1 hypothetical protein [Xanthomonas oryzae pv. oryzae MAFF 311018]
MLGDLLRKADIPGAIFPSMAHPEGINVVLFLDMLHVRARAAGARRWPSSQRWPQLGRSADSGIACYAPTSAHHGRASRDIGIANVTARACGEHSMRSEEDLNASTARDAGRHPEHD